MMPLPRTVARRMAKNKAAPVTASSLTMQMSVPSLQMIPAAQTFVVTAVSKQDSVSPDAVPVDWIGQELVVMTVSVLHVIEL